jgi:putative transport protein
MTARSWPGAAAERIAADGRIDIGYAMIFPSMTIVKVIVVQIVGLLVTAGAG